MKIYISGPISGMNPIEARWRFEKAQMYLENLGHSVVNPMNMGNWGLRWTTYMALAKVTICSGEIDAMYLMPKWEQSMGCILERKWATEKGVNIYYDIKKFRTTKRS